MWQLFIGPATPRPDFSIFPVRYIFTILHSPHFTLTYPTLLSLVFTTVHIHTAVLLVYSLPFAYRPFSFHIHQLCLSLLFFLVTTFHTHILFSSLCHIHHLSHSNTIFFYLSFSPPVTFTCFFLLLLYSLLFTFTCRFLLSQNLFRVLFSVSLISFSIVILFSLSRLSQTLLFYLTFLFSYFLFTLFSPFDPLSTKIL